MEGPLFLQPLFGVCPALFQHFISPVSRKVSVRRHHGATPGGGHAAPAVSSRALPGRVLTLLVPQPQLPSVGPVWRSPRPSERVRPALVYERRGRWFSRPCGRCPPRGEAAHLPSPLLPPPPIGRLFHNWSTWALEVPPESAADQRPHPELAISSLPPANAPTARAGAPRCRLSPARLHPQGAGRRALGWRRPRGRGRGGGAGGAREGPAAEAAAAAAAARAARLGPGSVGAAPRASPPGTRPPRPGAQTQRAPAGRDARPGPGPPPPAAAASPPRARLTAAPARPALPVPGRPRPRCLPPGALAARAPARLRRHGPRARRDLCGLHRCAAAGHAQGTGHGLQWARTRTRGKLTTASCGTTAM